MENNTEKNHELGESSTKTVEAVKKAVLEEIKSLLKKNYSAHKKATNNLVVFPIIFIINLFVAMLLYMFASGFYKLKDCADWIVIKTIIIAILIMMVELIFSYLIKKYLLHIRKLLD